MAAKTQEKTQKMEEEEDNLDKKTKCEKGMAGYLKIKKRRQLLITVISFAVVFAIFFAGLLICKTRNNYATLVATVLVLPSAKFAVNFLVLFSHHSAGDKLVEEVTQKADGLSICFDCVFSNAKKPIGTQAVIITDNTVCALTDEENADTTLFENSLRDFLKNEKLNVTVTLYKDEKKFLSRVGALRANFDFEKEICTDRMKWNTEAVKNMCM
jgi:hypothetical protein